MVITNLKCNASLTPKANRSQFGETTQSNSLLKLEIILQFKDNHKVHLSQVFFAIKVNANLIMGN